MKIKRTQFLGMPLDVGASADDVCDLLRKKGELNLVTFINPAAWSLAKKDPNYRATLDKMSLVLPDGEGVALACRMLTDQACPRLSFDMTSLADPFFTAAVEKKLSLVLVGGSPGLADNVQTKLQLYYPGLKVVETLHGYGDFAQKVGMIKSKKPDAVIVAMGAPRQEAFLMELLEADYNGLAITCGGFFDQYMAVDGAKYYPDWIDRWNLRFLYRLYREPGRLWRRYLLAYQAFLFAAGKAALPMLPQLARRAVTSLFGTISNRSAASRRSPATRQNNSRR